MNAVDVQWLFPDGTGGAPHPEGGVIRLPGALPGDRVHAEIVGRRGSTYSGRIEAIEIPSPDRQEPFCPRDALCGGCDLSRLRLERRHAALAEIVRRAFDLAAPPPIETSPRRIGHRARIKLAFEDVRIGYRTEGTHDLVDIDACPIARPEVGDALEKLRRWTAGNAETARTLAHVEIRSDGSRAVLAFSARPGEHPDRCALAELGDVALDGTVLSGDPLLWLDTDGLPLRASPSSFYQVNLEVNARLVAYVRDRVLELRSERVLELFAGIGNLTLPIARAGVPVVAVEREGCATADLTASASRSGLSPRVEVVSRPAESIDPSRSAFDVAVLDPPRTGAPGVLTRVVRNRPRAIVYVSCHAQSAARDLREALSAGYVIRDVLCFDMFPDTHHIESVVTLDRR